MQTRKIFIESCRELADERGDITISFPDVESLQKNDFWQSNEYDCCPEDLEVIFTASHIDLAIKLLSEHQEIDSLFFPACISSNNFEGKLRGDQLLVKRHGIYAEFINDWGNTHYQIPLSGEITELKTITAN